MSQHDNAANPAYQEHVRSTVAAVTEQLKAFGERNRLRGLEGRIQRGLDPAGMLAVEETRNKLDKIAQALGADSQEVVNLTNELHVGAIWKNADALAKGDNPNMQTWMVAGEVTVRGKEKEGDLSDEEFVRDLERVNHLLDEAAADPKSFAEQARTNLITHSKEQFKVEDGVPVSELDEGFLAMAINGYHSGIVKDKEGLLFVGADELDYGALEKMGLKMTQREDRGRQATFYSDSSGKEVVKKLYPGFAIVLTGDMEAAKQLAKTGEEKAKSKKE